MSFKEISLSCRIAKIRTFAYGYLVRLKEKTKDKAIEEKPGAMNYLANIGLYLLKPEISKNYSKE